MARLSFLASLLGLGAMLLATLRERRDELAVMRTLGASSLTIFSLIQLESLCVALLGILVGGISLLMATAMANPWLLAEYGIDIGLVKMTVQHLVTLSYVLFGTIFVGALPAFMGVWGSSRR